MSAINPYDLQQIVADLLKAMGYYPCWVSPPGAGRGTDIVAHPDPLGTRPPRLMQERQEGHLLIDPAGAGGGVGPASLLVMSGHQLGASIAVSFGRQAQRVI
ncbi:MAG: restriction endonuclease [Rhodopseudomonas palustris]|nr:restriction endonuclease [Rhodopseudomonas palustris]